MKKFALLVLFAMSSTASAQHVERYWNGYGWAYRQVQPHYQQPVYQQPVVKEVVKKENTTTVVNNLVGIPVPVQYTQPIAAQGTTVYGYSNVAEAYGQVDMGLLYNQAARLTDQAQQLAGQAATDFHSLVQAEGQNRADVAKIIAQGQAAREALSAAKGDPSAPIQNNYNFRSETKESVREDPDFDLGKPSLKQKSRSLDVSGVLQARCVSCHGNTKTSAGLNFLKPITDEQQEAVLERITTADTARRMPPNKKLSVGEFSALFDAMGPKARATK
jgi:cytochrome c553